VNKIIHMRVSSLFENIILIIERHLRILIFQKAFNTKSLIYNPINKFDLYIVLQWLADRALIYNVIQQKFEYK